MAIPVLEPLDFGKLELLNPRMQNLSTAPSSPVTGQFYYDTDDNIGYFWNGSTWVPMSGGGIAATIIDAKGDLIVGTAADTPARKAVGADGTFLVADSGETDGLEWRIIADADLPSTITRDSEAVLDGDTAGGVLSGTYPNPGFAADMATQAELDAHITAASDAHDASAVSFAPSGDIAATDVQAAVLEALADAKTYADALAQGLKIHASVKAVATSALDLSGAETIDGYSTSNGDRILATAQADADDNGIWVVAAGSWTRPADFDAAAEVAEGAFVFVEEGTLWESSGWVLAELAGSFGSLTTQTWERFSGAGQITAGTGLTQTGDTINAVAGATPGTAGPGGGLKANADDLVVDKDIVSTKYTTNVGDGAATSFNVDHNLGSDNVAVAVIRNSDDAAVWTGWAPTTVNRVVVTFAVAPSIDQYRVVVKG